MTGQDAALQVKMMYYRSACCMTGQDDVLQVRVFCMKSQDAVIQFRMCMTGQEDILQVRMLYDRNIKTDEKQFKSIS